MTQSVPTSHLNESIAIIGIGCRYPGGADNPQKLWKLLVNEIDAVTEIPADRVDIAPLYDPILATPGKIASNQGGFLKNIDQFDAAFFGISPREANYLDPQQRILLETAWEALEDAGLVPGALRDSLTGVYIGEWASDYTEKMYKASQDPNLYLTTGGGRYASSGRLSFFFGLQGPSLTVDTACSSSLVTVHLACQSLREGETNLALAGGTNVILEPTISVSYSRSKMLSPDGRCKFGDASANGYVRSEGVGLLVLKRLSDAITDGDRIYAVIRGSAVNNDGRSSELLVAPGIGSQIKMLREAYRSAGVDPAQVGYVEAHGTGTQVGDPVEMEALSTVISENRDPARPCRVGSIKTNIGHTESASGVAGLIKAALCLQHRTIPASLHYKNPNPKIPWAKLGMQIPTHLEPWPFTDGPAYAAVNSFGITGTNAHLVLEEAPALEESLSHEEAAEAYLLPLSAATPEAMRALASAYQNFLQEANLPALRDVCYTASVRRGHHSSRLAVSAASPAELAEQIGLLLEQKETAAPRGSIDLQAGVVFVFPGQGAQWLGMGRELLKHNTAFRETMQRCEIAIGKWAGWSLLEQLALEERAPGYRLNEISVIQPVLFAMEVALADVWRSFGIQPAAVIGHSMGEVAAAYIAGALSLDDAARVICKRSLLMQRTSGKGAMASIGLPYTAAEAAIRANGYENSLSIAVQNSPRSTVLSGDPAALDALIEKLREQEVFCRLVKVDVASHSPHMDPIRPELVGALADIQPQAAAIPFYSTVLQAACPGETLDAEYWGRNLRQPVRFSGTVQHLLEENRSLFIEMSPHPILLGAIEEVSKEAGQPAFGFASMRRSQPELVTLLGQLGALYTLGYPLDWSKLYPQGGRVVALPSYPWQREHYWFETGTAAKPTRPGAHPLLSSYLQTATNTHIWETPISTKHYAYLNDHQVRGSAVFPAAAYMEMVLAAGVEVYGAKPCLLKEIRYQEAFFVSAEDQLLQLMLTSDTTGTAEFHFYSHAQTGSWTLHASGKLEIQPDGLPSQPAALTSLLAGQDAVTEQAFFYQNAAGRGLDYGETFQSIHQLAPTHAGILAMVRLPADIAGQAAKYILHPVLLDACFQAMLFILPDTNQDTYLPSAISSLQVFATPDSSRELWCYVIPNQTGADLWLFNADGQPVLAATNLCMQRLTARQTGIQELFYHLDWQESPISAQTPAQPKRWLVFADRQGLGQALPESLQSGSHTCILVQAGSRYQASSPDCYEIDPCQPAHFTRLLSDIVPPVDGIVHLWSLDGGQAPSLPDASLLSLLYLTQALAATGSAGSPRLSIVTRGAQILAESPGELGVAQSSAWGMGAVIANELPALHCTCIDLSPTPDQNEADLLAQSLRMADDEDQLIIRSGRRFAARLKAVEAEVIQQAQQSVLRKNDEHLPFRVEVSEPGILDHLVLRPSLRKPVKAGEVEIAIKATGLNFMNILSALGMLPGYAGGTGPLGIECAGVISAVGQGVTAFAPGDEVVAIAFDSLASHAITDARLVVKKPDSMSFEQAAGLPIAYLTAYYAFHYLGHLQAGERVLIHAATGGVGLAAVELAKHIGAEIYATAGSPEKRAYLANLGIQHIMDSRSLAFADEILRETAGEGVDMVLNSLAGAAITRGLEILKPYGRFMEIGKRDIYANNKLGLLAFQKNLSFFAIDLDRMSRERPALVGAMLREVFALIEAGEIGLLPVQTFPVSAAPDAFRWMAQARHIGKIAITLDDPQAAFELPAGAAPVYSDGTYLVTGGLGDLGLAFTRWLAVQGARNIVLTGRSQPSAAAQQVLNELRASGVNVLTAQADVTDRQQLAQVFEGVLGSLPPLKGVIHAAGVLADATLQQMSAERFAQAYAPKALGAWHLHELTVNLPLDFFILFSSITATLGTPGQANYAAGNAFMDGLARYRRARNLPALSISWGPWSEIGLANQQANRGQRLVQQGIKSLSPLQGLAAMPVAMALDDAQVCVMPFDTVKWCAAQPAAARSSLFKDLQGQPAAESAAKQPAGKSIRAELLAVEAGRQRRATFETLLREQVAQVLSMPPARVAVDKALNTLGLDSLMSIELRNRLENALAVSLPATMIWNYPTIQALVPFLAERMGLALDSESQTPAVIDPPIAPAANDLDELDQNELEALLDDELSAIDEVLKSSPPASSQTKAPPGKIK